MNFYATILDVASARPQKTADLLDQLKAWRKSIGTQIPKGRDGSPQIIR